MKKMAIFIAVLLFGISSVWAQQPQVDNHLKAFRLAIEQNMQVRIFNNSCEYRKTWRSSDSVKSIVILIPLNKEVIDAAIEYKTQTEKLSNEESENLRVSNYSAYINGDLCAFTLLIKNNDNLDDDDEIYFKQIMENFYLHDEFSKYSLIRYTHVFDEKLSPGWNKGYLYFQNFRQKNSYSYSVHIGGYIVNSCPENNDHKAGKKWAFSFDESDLNFFALLEKGISEDVIRSRYGITANTSANLSGIDFFNIIGTILNIVSLIK